MSNRIQPAGNAKSLLHPMMVLAILWWSQPLATTSAEVETRPAVRHIAINRAVPCKELPLHTLQLAVLSARIENDQIELRVGLINGGDIPLSGPLSLEAADFNLIGSDPIPRNAPTSLEAELTLPPVGHTSLAPQAIITSSLHFALPENRGTLQLQATDFPDLTLDLNSPALRPPDLSGSRLFSYPDIEVKGIEGPLSIIPWKIRSIEMDSQTLTVHTSFTNKARAAITWSSPLTGGNLRLLDSERTLHAPIKISSELASGMGPPGQSWETGQENIGQVSFATPHPHALKELLLSFPGYPPVRLQFAPQARTYVASLAAIGPRNEPKTQVEKKASPALASEMAFRQIAELVADLNKALQTRDPSLYASAFRTDGTLRRRQDRFFHDTLKAPIHNVGYLLPPNQPFEISPDGTIEDAYLSFHYNIKGIAEDNYFVTLMKASFARGPTPSGWFITHIATVARPPFWELGYTGLCETEHFLIFYPSATESASNIREAIKQVETAYEDLSLQGFDLENRYAAFFVPSSHDFQALTTRDPERFSGVASSACEINGDTITTTNRAIYINDYRYLVQQRAWGVQSRQKTITHELVHLALSQYTRPFTPAWLVEGAAVHHAKQTSAKTRDVLRRADASRQLTLEEMSNSYLLGGNVSDSTKLSLMYSFAGETFGYLRHRFGSRRVFDFYRAFAQPSGEDLECILPARQAYATNPTDSQMAEITQRMTRRLLREHFGVSLMDLTQSIKSGLKIR